MFTADGKRRDFPIKKGRVIIGRTNSCGLRVPLSSVSREHCEISIHGDEIILRDLGSSNGTYHNNLRIQEAEVLPGDEISIGPVVFTVVVDGKPDDIEPVRTIIDEKESLSGTEDAAIVSSSDSDEDMDLLGPEYDDEADASVRELAQALESDHDDLMLPSLDDDAGLAAGLDSDDSNLLGAGPDVKQVEESGNRELAEAMESDEGDMGMELPTIEQLEDDDDGDALSPIVELDDPLGALDGISDSDDDEFGDLILEDED